MPPPRRPSPISILGRSLPIPDSRSPAVPGPQDSPSWSQKTPYMAAESGEVRRTEAAIPGAAESRAVPRLRRGVTLRGLLLGLLLIPFNVFLLVHAVWTVGGFSGSESLLTNTVGLLFLLGLSNQWLLRRHPRLAFTTGEMLTIYLMLGISTGLVCSVWDLGGSLAGTIPYPFWFATPENKWRELLWPNLPSWLTVQDHDALD